MSNHQQRVLVVEDEPAILFGLKENLESAGYAVVTATDGPTALQTALTQKPDLLLLDIMLPGMSGYEVCRKLREQGFRAPVMMLTARGEEFDKLHGFETGADDYVTKPFSVAELLARIRAVLARGARPDTGPRTYEFDDFVLDLDARVLRKKASGEGKSAVSGTLRGRHGSSGKRPAAGGKRAEGSPTRNGAPQAQMPDDHATGDWEDITLTRTEFDLLAYFCANEGKALSREKVMNDVWGTQYFGTQRSLDSFVASLRATIEKKQSEPTHILTLHGVGYKFVK